MSASYRNWLVGGAFLVMGFWSFGMFRTGGVICFIYAFCYVAVTD